MDLVFSNPYCYIDPTKTMSESQDDKGLITSKKIQSGMAGYIWNSPCFKPLAYNPFLASAVILGLLLAIDFLYGKIFVKGGIAMMIQHAALTYVIIATGMTLNNMLIKHNYRLKKYNNAKEEVESKVGDEDLVSSYVD